MNAPHPMHARLIVLPRAARAAWLEEHQARQRLIAGGHSGAKTAEILLDCRRGNRYALAWLLALMPVTAATSDPERDGSRL